VWHALSGVDLEFLCEDRPAQAAALLAMTDRATCDALAAMIAIDDRDVFDAAFAGGVTFTAELSDGRVVPTVPHGRTTRVTHATRHAYARSVVRTRLLESAPQLRAIRSGLDSVISARVVEAHSWRALAAAICGTAEVDLAVLRQHTETAPALPRQVVAWFWEALASFTAEQRSAFVKFAWARSRLPATAAQWEGHRMRLMALNVPAGRNHDGFLPQAETCFFNVSLPPRWSSAKVVREKLALAILHNSAMSGD
jgi:hypothetical protein